MAATKKKSAGKRRTPASKKKKQVQTGHSMECSGCFCRTFNQ